MNPVTRFALLALCCGIAGHAGAQDGWKHLAAAADAQQERPGPVSLRFGWETPKKRLLMLARQGEDQAVLYQIDHKAGLKPADMAKQVNCHFEKDRLYCTGPGQAEPSLVAGPQAEWWTALEAHAAVQMQRLDTLGRESLQAQLATLRPAAHVDLSRQRHPFEWGGEYETVENAQAFLESATAHGMGFRSSWPLVPPLGSNKNLWQNQNDRVTLRTTGRCMMLASSPARTAIHYNHDFWTADTVKKEAVYRWQQPIDWTRIEGVKKEQDGVFFHGNYAGTFPDQALNYLSGWSPSMITANASRFDASKYSVAAWNLHLLPSAGLHERVVYAVTYLDIMCRKG